MCYAPARRHSRVSIPLTYVPASGTSMDVSKSNRNNPMRSESSDGTFSLMEFHAEFPDDVACLEWLKNRLYPDGIFCEKCQKVTKHHRIKTRTSYACQFCGHHVHPMKGTIFEDSATSLKLWFHAIFLMASTRCGISAKQLERELGVTYKCAWRIFNRIRSLLEDEGDPLSGQGRSGRKVLRRKRQEQTCQQAEGTRGALSGQGNRFWNG